MAGVDEVGRGSFAGPMVIGLVVYNEWLGKVRGLNDSKLLSPAKREALFKKIIANCEYGIGMCWPHEIDKDGISKGLQMCVDRAFDCIESPDYLFVDGRVKLELPFEHETMVKGDMRVRCIAAGSIIAKVFRDQMMKEYCKLIFGYDLRNHVGYGTVSHRRRIKQLGPSRIHRRTFLRNTLNA